VKTALPIILGVLALVIGSFFIVRGHNAMIRSLPPVVDSTHAEVQSLMLAGADMVAVLGTGSMQPYIPAGKQNSSEIVAYVQVERVAFDKLRRGDLIIFRFGNLNILHQLAAKDGDGWIASGLHNERYDYPRVNVGNFVGRVSKTYLLP
jgi:uncharacterized protein YxeA